MKDVLNFLIEVGKLKRNKRKGWVINQIKDPESIAEHVFRATILGWILGRKKKGINIEKLIKMALGHDLCEIYAGDTTPYDSILPKNKKQLKELMKTWPRFSDAGKERICARKYKKEKKGLEKLIAKLPTDLKSEIRNI